MSRLEAQPAHDRPSRVHVGPTTLYVVPESSESSWARTLLRTRPEEVCAALEGQADVEEAVQNGADATRGSSF